MFEAMSLPQPDSESSLQERFWRIVLETTAGMEIREGCQGHLRDFIQHGVDRMRSEDRLGSDDMDTAAASLRAFVDLMKQQAIARDHPGWIGEDTYYGAQQVAHFELWPFWPLF